MRPVLFIFILALVPPCANAQGKSAPIHGAIAYHRDSASYGYAVDRKTARDAKVEALKQCGRSDCEVVASFQNGCSAVANGPKRFKAANGAVRQEAEAKALRLCGERCQIVVWACTR
jgi:hypothetical protein